MNGFERCLSPIAFTWDIRVQHDRRSPAEAAVATGAWFGLLVLFIVGWLNFADRNVVYILQQPIKGDLGLSDMELGAVGGLALALVYSFAAFPFARNALRLGDSTSGDLSVVQGRSVASASGRGGSAGEIVTSQNGARRGTHAEPCGLHHAASARPLLV